MTPFSTFFDLLRPIVPNVAAPTATRVARDAAIECLRESRAWREVVAGNTVAGTANLTFTMPGADDTLSVARVFSVSAANQKLTRTSAFLLSQNGVDWQTRQGSIPARYIPGRGRSIEVYPIPSGVVPVTARVALVPTLRTTEIPDDLFDELGSMIRDKAAGMLFAVPGTGYTNVAQARMYMDRAQEQIDYFDLKARGDDGVKGGSGNYFA